ncbi:IPTL-CTERM sorting domain-containing protein, partial [Pseudomonadota bacterium]
LKTLLITLLTAASATLSAAPVGYTINSDSTTSEPDSLYLIDLLNGQTIKNVGIVQLPPLATGRRMDVEGLAFAPDGTLYGIDDESLKLFRINPATALVDSSRDYQIVPGVLTPKNNDFGMTFACDGSLYVTSVDKQSLYQVVITGSDTATTTKITDLGAKISALAAWGNPTQLYGLSNGELYADVAGRPHLYRINPADGVVTDLGELGGDYAQYAQAGLGFDDSGQLWAMTDRSPSEPSQILKINLGTTPPKAEQVILTSEQGFESLAVAPPGGCNDVVPGDYATFVAQKQFTDGNNITPVTFNFKCTGGTVLNSSKTIFPDADGFGPYQVAFNVGDLPSGAVECDITEEPVVGYTPEYECESDATCSTSEGAGPCLFQSVQAGVTGSCLVRNQVDPVEITVTKEWLYKREDTVVNDSVEISLYCSYVADGDGDSTGEVMSWTWEFDGSPASNVATLYPDFNGETECWTQEHAIASAIESESTCSAPVSILLGDTERDCDVTNTVFFEGIPTLNPYGLALISALMLLTGLISVRRIV